MQSIGFVARLLPGMTQIDREALNSGRNGERNATYEDSRRRAGSTRDVAVIVLQADDIGAELGVIATSAAPFDIRFRDHVQQVQGLSFADGFPPPEVILGDHSDRAGR